LPAASISTLPGRRVEEYRAGMTARTERERFSIKNNLSSKKPSRKVDELDAPTDSPTLCYGAFYHRPAAFFHSKITGPFCPFRSVQRLLVRGEVPA